MLPHPLLAIEGAGVPPQAEKSLDIGMEGVFTGSAGLGFGAVIVVVGSGVAHASLDPQASMLLKAEDVLGAAVVGFGVGWEGAAGAERLNAELRS